MIIWGHLISNLVPVTDWLTSGTSVLFISTNTIWYIMTSASIKPILIDILYPHNIDIEKNILLFSFHKMTLN